MRYAVYDSVGRITKTGTCPDSHLELLNLTEDFVLVLGDNEFCRDDAHYIDMDTQEVVAMGTRPSKHHHFDYTTHTWGDTRTLSELKQDKNIEINAARDAAEYGGFEWSTYMFDSDAVSVTRISGAVQLATITGSGFTIDWTLADNSVVTLDQADMIAVGVALGTHVGAQHEHARDLKADVAAATTPAEVAAITW